MHFILLKQPDGRDSGRARPNATLRVFSGNAAQSHDRNLFLASFPESIQAGEAGRCISLLKDWPEDGEVRA